MRRNASFCQAAVQPHRKNLRFKQRPHPLFSRGARPVEAVFGARFQHQRRRLRHEVRQQQMFALRHRRHAVERLVGEAAFLPDRLPRQRAVRKADQTHKTACRVAEYMSVPVRIGVETAHRREKRVAGAEAHDRDSGLARPDADQAARIVAGPDCDRRPGPESVLFKVTRQPSGNRCGRNRPGQPARQPRSGEGPRSRRPTRASADSAGSSRPRHRNRPGKARRTAPNRKTNSPGESPPCRGKLREPPSQIYGSADRRTVRRRGCRSRAGAGRRTAPQVPGTPAPSNGPSRSGKSGATDTERAAPPASSRGRGSRAHAENTPADRPSHAAGRNPKFRRPPRAERGVAHPREQEVERVEPHGRIGRPDQRVRVRHKSLRRAVLRQIGAESDRKAAGAGSRVLRVDELRLDALRAEVDAEIERHMPTSADRCRRARTSAGCPRGRRQTGTHTPPASRSAPRASAPSKAPSRSR